MRSSVNHFKSYLGFILIVCLTTVNGYRACGQLRSVTNRAFRPGEVLDYRIHYGLIDAGEARLEVTETMYNVHDRLSYHIIGSGKTLGAFDWFFKVRDRYESYVDKDALIPWIFIRRVEEGGYRKKQDVNLDRKSTRLNSSH